MNTVTFALVLLVVLVVLAAAVCVGTSMRLSAVLGGAEACACGGNDDENPNYVTLNEYGHAGTDGNLDTAFGTEFDTEFGTEFGTSGKWTDFSSAYGGAGRPFRLPAREPWYSAYVAKKGGVLLRLNRAPFTTLAVGDQVSFVRSRPLGDMSTHATPRCTATIKKITKYASFEAALKEVGMDAAPGSKTPAEGAARLYMNPEVDKATEAEQGVLAIALEQVKPEAPRPALGAPDAGKPRGLGARRALHKSQKGQKSRKGRGEDAFAKVWES